MLDLPESCISAIFSFTMSRDISRLSVVSKLFKYVSYSDDLCVLSKWVSEIKEPKKKSKIWLGSFDTPEMAARAYDVAEFYLKGKKQALLNFSEMIDHLLRPLSLSLHDIQVAAEEAAVAFYFRKQERKSPRNPPVSNEPPSSHQLLTVISSGFESTDVDLPGEADTSNYSSSVCTPTKGVGESENTVVEDDSFESFNLFTNLAEAPLLSPRPLFNGHEEGLAGRIPIEIGLHVICKSLNYHLGRRRTILAFCSWRWTRLQIRGACGINSGFVVGGPWSNRLQAFVSGYQLQSGVCP